MRAVICRAWGEPEGLVVEDVAPPTPGPHEVVIDVKATGVNYADAIMVAGRYQTRPAFPFSPGLETGGTVARCGPGVTRFKAGDRVMAILAHGGFAEQVVASEDETFAMPNAMPFEEGAHFPSRTRLATSRFDGRRGLREERPCLSWAPPVVLASRPSRSARRSAPA
jgi:NADPH2:quinone reductase